MSRPRAPPTVGPVPEAKGPTFLTILGCIALIIYYSLGKTNFPDVVLLSIAAQVVSKGIISLTAIIQQIIAYRMENHPVSLDFLTAWTIEVDARTGGPFNPDYIVVHSFVTLFLMHTPEITIGSFGSNVIDIRGTAPKPNKTIVGAYSGAWCNTTDCSSKEGILYYTSGLILFSSSNLDQAYKEIAFKVNGDLVIPRKPVAWYRKFGEGESGVRDNNRESQLRIAKNPVVILENVSSPARGRCNESTFSDFYNYFTMVTCPGNGTDPPIFGFSINGTYITKREKFYKLYNGIAIVEYSSKNGARQMKGSIVHKDKKSIPFPRRDTFLKEMGGCFLNAMAYRRTDEKGSNEVDVDRVAISALVRIGSVENKWGFEENACLVEAEEMEVVVSNLSRFTLLAVVVATVLCIATTTIFWMKPKRFSSEMAQFMALGENGGFAKIFSTMPRYMVKGRIANCKSGVFACQKVMLKEIGEGSARALRFVSVTGEREIHDDDLRGEWGKLGEESARSSEGDELRLGGTSVEKSRAVSTQKLAMEWQSSESSSTSMA